VGTYSPIAIPVVLTTREEIDIWMLAPSFRRMASMRFHCHVHCVVAINSSIGVATYRCGKTTTG
jgi:hypothetical protein